MVTRALNPCVVSVGGGPIRVPGRPVAATPPTPRGPFTTPGTVTVWLLDEPGDFLVRAQNWGPHYGDWVATVLVDGQPVHVFAQRMTP